MVNVRAHIVRTAQALREHRHVVVRIIAGLATAAAVTVAIQPHDTLLPSRGQNVPTYVETLIDLHDCWTSAAPEGVTIPGHVIATKPGDNAPGYYGPRVTGQALQQLFDGADHGLTVHAFCR